MGLLKIFKQNLHIYHRNKSTSLCTIHFIYRYILVLEDVISSDVGGRFLLAHPVFTLLHDWSIAMEHAKNYEIAKLSEIYEQNEWHLFLGNVIYDF